MIVGSDERRYAWMDEGFNTFINHYSAVAFYQRDPQQALRRTSPGVANLMREPAADQPIMTWPDAIRPEGLGFLAYRKPGFGLILLREAVLGPERFDAAFRQYVQQWAYRHPQPSDFFRTIEAATGEELSWFWRQWFYGTDQLDQAVDSVAVVADGTARLFLSNRSGLVMPVVVELLFADGRVVRRTLPVEIWIRSNTFVLPLDGGMPERVTLDPDGILPDANRDNNTWRGVPHTR
jgi:hypothetical protein